MPVGNFENSNLNYYSISKDSGRIKHKVRDTGEIEEYSYIEGYLYKIEATQEEYQGEPTQRIKFYLTDKKGEETDILACGRHTWFTRSILNRLANCDEIGYIRITPYVSEIENSDRTLTFGSLRLNGLKVKPKFEKGQYPAIGAVAVGGKNYQDPTLINNFFDDMISEIVAKLKYDDISKIRVLADGEELPRGAGNETSKSNETSHNQNAKADTATHLPKDDSLPWDDEVPPPVDADVKQAASKF